MLISGAIGIKYPKRPCFLACSLCFRSLELLYALGALDQQGALSKPLGQQMARLPVDPMYAKVLLAAAGAAGAGGSGGGCAIEAMQVVAMMSAENIFFTPRWVRGG
jgi:ATP-dependent RNA helicase DHX8/PRP22